MTENTYAQKDFEKAAITGVQALAKSSNKQTLRAAILRAFGTASLAIATRKAGIKFDMDEAQRETLLELVEPMLKSTTLGSEVLNSVIGLLKADFDFREANPDADQSGTAWAYSLGAYINPQRLDLEKKCEALFGNTSIAANIKTNAMSALTK